MRCFEARTPSVYMSRNLRLSRELKKLYWQLKGFLVYVQVEEVWMVPLAQKIFRQFDEFKKCDVARHTAEAETPKTASEDEVKVGEPEPMETEIIESAHCTFKEEEEELIPEHNYGTVVVVKEEKIDDLEDFDDLFAGPMIPQRSCGEMGQ